MFKAGDWIIRKWNKEYKSSIDFCQFKNEDSFLADKYFRFTNNDNDITVNDLSIEAQTSSAP